MTMVIRKSWVCFRPLAGFWFLNYGDVGVVYYTEQRSFRPLAGFWFLNNKRYVVPLVEDFVSVPLRGSGS